MDCPYGLILKFPACGKRIYSLRPLKLFLPQNPSQIGRVSRRICPRTLYTRFRPSRIVTTQRFWCVKLAEGRSIPCHMETERSSRLTQTVNASGEIAPYR